MLVYCTTQIFLISLTLFLFYQLLSQGLKNNLQEYTGISTYHKCTKKNNKGKSVDGHAEN